MKKLLTAAFIFSACNISQETIHHRIEPRDCSIYPDSVGDCTLSAQFTADDFNWDKNSLTFRVFTQDIYDSADICHMKMGDTLLYGGLPMAVTSIVADHNCMVVNGGLENGGACLVPYTEGSFRTQTWDDHSTYTKHGQLELQLAPDFIIVDCGENPSDPSDTIGIHQREYLSQMPNHRQEYFFELNTIVRIHNGEITEIHRRWIP